MGMESFNTSPAPTEDPVEKAAREMEELRQRNRERDGFDENDRLKPEKKQELEARLQEIDAEIEQTYTKIDKIKAERFNLQDKHNTFRMRAQQDASENRSVHRSAEYESGLQLGNMDTEIENIEKKRVELIGEKLDIERTIAGRS